MKLVFLLVLIISVHGVFCQKVIQDSIIKAAERVVFDSDFRNSGYDFLFSKNGKRFSLKNKTYLDTLVHQMEMYKGCECEIVIDALNEVPRKLNIQRIKVLNEQVGKRTDSSQLPLKIYWQGEYENGFERIFEADEETLAYIQRSVDVRVNCDQSFHIINESLPFTGHHVWTDNGRIYAISAYKKGLKHGRSYVWVDKSSLVVTNYFEGKIVSEIKR